jgi:hypothetical protein
MMLKVFGLLMRYALAVVVAFFISVVTMIVGAPLFAGGIMCFLTDSCAGYHLAIFMVAFVAAFAGVLAGSLCLFGRDRRLACITLTILGLIYYFGWYDSMKANPEFSDHPGFPLMLPLTAGGLCAFALTCLIVKYRKQPLSKTQL